MVVVGMSTHTTPDIAFNSAIHIGFVRIVIIVGKQCRFINAGSSAVGSGGVTAAIGKTIAGADIKVACFAA